MTAKKLWARKFYHDSQELHKNSQGDISWSSSDSECGESNPKRIKITNQKSWINSSVTEHLKNSEGASQIFISNDTIALPSSPTLTWNCFQESPIINNISQEELSPVLVENTHTDDASNETSPVIGKQSVLKRVRSKYIQIKKVKHNIFPAREASPDIFQSQPTQQIDNHCSPDPRLGETKITISQSSECAEPKVSPPSSQKTKQSSDTSSSKTDNSSLYHQPERKRKRYKKGGIAWQLQKTLQLQKTRIARWQHEMYTNKSDSFQELSGENIIKFIVKKCEREYGSVALCAELLKEENASDIFLSAGDKTSQFVLILVSSMVTINFGVGEKYQLFPPYCSKEISYKSKNMICYYAVSKIMVSKR